uniref:DNA mismatch repair proteins mutS family domain-containing protein n=1 Tax=Ditylenchus dipsaci TaxID=166011 RepID=A0A915DFS1_9BILA
MTATILCISYSGKKIGAALYEEDTTVVRILHDTTEEDNFSMLMLTEVQPSHVIVNKSQDINFLLMVRKQCNFAPEIQKCSQTNTRLPLIANRTTQKMPPQEVQLDGHKDSEQDLLEDEEVFRPAVNFFPNIAFNANEAKKRLERMFNDDSRDGKLAAAFRFDYSAVNMIKSIGALLRYLEQQRIGVEFEEYDVKTPIKSIISLSLNELMEVDAVTQQALEIFHSDYNPQNIRRKFIFGNSRKEGMSIFKLCNICKSTPGKLLLKSWFERPTKNREVLQQRQEGVSFFFHDCNLDALNFMRNRLKDIMSIRGIIKRMQRGNLSINDWKNLYLTVCTLVKIGEYLTEREVRLNILKEKMAFFGEDLLQLATVLVEMIDFPESLSENRFVLKAGVDQTLDELKAAYEQLPEMLTSVAKMEAEELHIDSCSVAYVPILGYLLMISEEIKVPNISMVQMLFSAEDEEVGDIKMKIIDTETTITLRLEKLVLKRSGVILRALESASILDCLSSLAVVARDYNWTRPRFVDESMIDVAMARHPIAELICKSSTTYVPNPIMSSENYSKLKILSGPNASGKSVYLKMIGTITYLAHVGSFVPAEKAVFGPINRIMSRMYTIDSVLDGMSSFANDLKQMSSAIRKSDANSLLIIDEFGKGTMTEVGLSLLASCLNYWLEKPGGCCPHLFVASHFHALRNLLVESDLILYQTMDVIRKENDDLEFQFKLVDGVIDNSYATLTALKMGIPKAVVDRADEVYLHLREQRSAFLIGQMESIMDSFASWDMEADPKGFLELAERVFSADLQN